MDDEDDDGYVFHDPEGHKIFSVYTKMEGADPADWSLRDFNSTR